MTADLFGHVDPPKPGGPDYLQYLQGLQLPDGLTFDSASSNSYAPGVPQKSVVQLWCRDPENRLVHLVFDLRTGAKYEGENR